MYKKLGIALLVCSMLLIPGCTQNEVNNQESQAMIALQKENEELKQTIDTLEKEITTIKEENENLKQTAEEASKEASKEAYTIYTRDVNSWEIVEISQVKVDKEQPLQDKIQTLADNLSKECFEGLEIKVEEIKEIGDKQIAIINLLDDSKKQNPNWMMNFFQGSTGAGITATSLEETLLQRDSQYTWVDGIEIFYNDEVLSDNHIEFNGIIYR